MSNSSKKLSAQLGHEHTTIDLAASTDLKSFKTISKIKNCDMWQETIYTQIVI